MARKEKKYHFIYKTIDTRNGNFYIGMHSTDDLNDGYVGSGDRIRRLKYRYGKEILKLEILEFLPNRNLLKKREEEIVNSDLLKENKCMNLRTGGAGFSSEEAIIAINKSNERQKYLRENDAEWVKKRFENNSKARKKDYEIGVREKGIFCDWTGKKHSEETKKQMSEQRKGTGIGNKNSQFGTMWITNGSDNRKIKKEDKIPLGWFKGRKT